MKRNLQLKTVQTIIAFVCVIFVPTSTLFSQTAPIVSEWRSVTSGDFSNAGGTIWEKNVLGAWTLQIAAAKPSGSSNVTIRAGHTVTISATTSILGLTIEAGAKLNSSAAITAPITFRVGTSSSADVTAGATGNTVVIQNDGILGSLADADAGLNLEVEKNCKTLTLQGNGTCRIGRTRFLYPNLNVPATFNINQSMYLGLAGSGSFTAYYNNAANIAAENNVINIAAGKTVTLATGGSFHGGVSSTPPSNPQGTITYNISGTLDLSATAAGGLQTSTNATGAASLNLNIKSGGVMKLGTSFAAYKGASNGSINMTIENGGVVDGTLLTTGVTNNNSTLNTGYTWFVTQGTGVLKLPVASTSQTFPVGTDATHYNPVTMNNGGGTVYAVGVNAGNTPTGLPRTTLALNRTWTVSPASTADLNFGFNTGEGNGSCVLTDGMGLYNSSGGAWTSLGTATPSVPSSGATGYQVGYSAVAFAGTIFNLANVMNVPVELMSFKGYAKGNTNQLMWATASERNNAEFVIERSTDGINFNRIGSVKGNGTTSSVNNYAFTDFEGPLSISYYKLRQIDFNGRETVSKVLTIVRTDKSKEGILKTYPTVSETVLTVDYTSNSTTTLKIIDVLGQTVLSKIVKDNDGYNSTQLDVSSLASGLYILSFESATTRMTKNIIKN
jgi:hypothetical protein